MSEFCENRYFDKVFILQAVSHSAYCFAKIVKSKNCETKQIKKISLNKLKKVVAPKLCAQPKCMISCLIALSFTLPFVAAF